MYTYKRHLSIISQQHEETYFNSPPFTSFEQGTGPPAQGAGPEVQGAGPTSTQGAGPPSAQGAGPPRQEQDLQRQEQDHKRKEPGHR